MKSRHRVPGLGTWSWTVALALSLVAAVSPASAQPIRFARYSLEQGLSQVTVNSIVQDHQGFLWLGTEDGLNRFDGYEFTVYRRAAGDPTTLPNNAVWTVVEELDGDLWIATEGGGVAEWDRQSETFERFRQRSAADFTRVLHLDAEGMVWIGTREAGLLRRDPRTGAVVSFRHDPAVPGSLGHDAVYALASTLDGSLWVGTEAGLERFDRDRETFTHYRHDPEQPTSLADERIRALLEDRDGMLWVGTYGGGLERLLPSGDGFEHFRHDPQDPASLAHDRIRSLLEDDAGRLWIGTAGGLSLYDRRQGRFQTYRHDPTDPTSLSDDDVMSLYQDRGGVLWVGTRTGGLNAWHPNLWTFGHVAPGPGSLQNGVVTSFAEGDPGQLWIGTFGGGVHRLDRPSGEMRYFRHDPARPQSLASDHVMALLHDSRGTLWIGTLDAGLQRFDAATETFSRIGLPDDAEGLGREGVTALLEDHRGDLWLGLFGGGLLRFDRRTSGFERFAAGEQVICLAEDGSNRLWLGTDGHGLLLLEPGEPAPRSFRHDPDDPTSLGADTVFSLHVDRSQRLWVGTRGGGLARLELDRLTDDRPAFQSYTQADGLSNDVVYGIEPDSQGRLWLSTNFGLSVLTPEDGTFETYHADQGLQSDEFNFGAHASSPSGELFFGGIRGFNAFYPHQLATNDHRPPVVLTRVLKRNQPLTELGSIAGLDRLELGYRDDVVSFEFAALDFVAPERNRYRYMLEGFDEEWIQLGHRRRVTYTDLDGGQYVFRVEAANNDGLWNEDALELAIRVAPPPWKSWWAYGSYLALGFIGTAGLGASQRRKLEREQQYSHRLEKEVAERTEELAMWAQQLNKMNQELAEASLTDPLTGLRNRRFLFQHIGEETSLVERRYRKLAQGVEEIKVFDLAFLMVDLDNFKEINDTCGHLAGDHVLMQLRGVLEASCRESDLIIRWGGDEFLIVARDSSPEEAEALAERLRDAIRDDVFTLDDGRIIRATCSIGFACFPFVRHQPDAFSWEDVLALADSALYAAKRTSRDAWVGLVSNQDTSAEVISRLRIEPVQVVAEKRLEVHTSIDSATGMVWS